MGKPQSGVLKGQKTFVGQYDECREVSHETQNGHVIQGQLCTPQVQMNFSSFGEKGVRSSVKRFNNFVNVTVLVMLNNQKK